MLYLYTNICYVHFTLSRAHPLGCVSHWMRLGFVVFDKYVVNNASSRRYARVVFLSLEATGFNDAPLPVCLSCGLPFFMSGNGTIFYDADLLAFFPLYCKPQFCITLLQLMHNMVNSYIFFFCPPRPPFFFLLP